MTMASLLHLAECTVTSKLVDVIRNRTRLLVTQHMCIIFQSTFRGFVAAFLVAGFGSCRVKKLRRLISRLATGN